MILSAVKNAADNIAASSNEQIVKIAEIIKNNAYFSVIMILDSVIAELSLESLEKAKNILKRITW